MNNKIQNKKITGFTIIELIVVIAIFFLVIGAAVGIFLSLVHNQKKVLLEQQLLNQLSYLEEHMSKALRTAGDGDTSCIPSGYIYLLLHQANQEKYTGIKFMNQSDNDACEQFFLDTDGMLKEIKNGGNAVLLTPSNLKINFIKFSINGKNGTVTGQDCVDTPDLCGALKTTSVQEPQPRVTITMNVNIPGDVATRTIQTTVSRRNLNVLQ